MSITEFLERHFRHFNARETLAAARGWKSHIESGGKMFLAMAGAMSTGELGVSLAEMIRRDMVHAISTTGANLEEDIFNLVGKSEYRQVPHYRHLSPAEETKLRDAGFNRVTDTCIPETVFRHIEGKLLDYWTEASERSESYFPYEYLFRLIEEGTLDNLMQIPREDSWLVAACEKRIPVYTPGWEDSTLGNIFTARTLQGKIKNHDAVKPGTMQMEHLINWYIETSRSTSIGFFQIGGGIAGDFAICVVPLILQDLKQEVPFWGYFAQISDAITSFGSYSGAAPNEKITWFKIDEDTPRFMIQSDATIVAPLIFAYVLGK